MFVRLRFPQTADASDLQARMIAYDPLGFLEEEHWWEVYFDRDAWERSESAFRSACERDGIAPTFEREEIAKENWNELWEQSIEPIQVSDHLFIAPSWKTVDAPSGSMIITIDPKMSFGTGYHATTRLMLRLLERHVRAGDRVLDMGTGTGVLAIAAVRLGAMLAEGLDTDEWSYDNALENAQRNGVADRVLLGQGSIENVEGTFDVILSNITKIDNLQMLPRFDVHLNPGGRIILSGFYEWDARDIHLALEQLRLHVDEEITEDEWSAIAARKEDI